MADSIAIGIILLSDTAVLAMFNIIVNKLFNPRLPVKASLALERVSYYTCLSGLNLILAILGFGFLNRLIHFFFFTIFYNLFMSPLIKKFDLF